LKTITREIQLSARTGQSCITAACRGNTIKYSCAAPPQFFFITQHTIIATTNLLLQQYKRTYQLHPASCCYSDNAGNCFLLLKPINIVEQQWMPLIPLLIGMATSPDRSPPRSHSHSPPPPPTDKPTPPPPVDVKVGSRETWVTSDEKSDKMSANDFEKQVLGRMNSEGIEFRQMTNYKMTNEQKALIDENKLPALQQFVARGRVTWDTNKNSKKKKHGNTTPQARQDRKSLANNIECDMFMHITGVRSEDEKAALSHLSSRA
jgi:hypothetical protein